MASSIKITHAAMSNENGHIDRLHDNPSNYEIDPSRTHLNYSFPMAYKGIKPFKYYKNLIDEKYMHFRGTRSEKNTNTGFAWVITLPKELAGNSQKEKAFFKGVFDFVANRYGLKNIINNSVHYDESGLPHIHIIICPVTALNHDLVQYKTKRTKQAIKLPSGRYEYKQIHVDKDGNPVDENNPDTWVKLNNYARMSDYYDEKIDCKSVLNPIELRHFHIDLQEYLVQKGIEGKVITGKTGTNFTVKELKEFTKTTGLRIEDVKEMMQDNKSLLQSFVDLHDKNVNLEEAIKQKDSIIEALKNELTAKEKVVANSLTISQKDAQIQTLIDTISSKDQELALITSKNTELEQKVAEMELIIEATKIEAVHTQPQTENQKSVEITQSDTSQGWGQDTGSSWGNKSNSGWGTKSTTIETTW